MRLDSGRTVLARAGQGVGSNENEPTPPHLRRSRHQPPKPRHHAPWPFARAREASRPAPPRQGPLRPKTRSEGLGSAASSQARDPGHSGETTTAAPADIARARRDLESAAPSGLSETPPIRSEASGTRGLDWTVSSPEIRRRTTPQATGEWGADPGSPSSTSVGSSDLRQTFERRFSSLLIDRGNE